MADTTTFGANAKRLRLRARLHTLETAAQATGLRVVRLSEIEHDRYKVPTRATVLKLAQGYGAQEWEFWQNVPPIERQRQKKVSHQPQENVAKVNVTRPDTARIDPHGRILSGHRTETGGLDVGNARDHRGAYAALGIQPPAADRPIDWPRYLSQGATEIRECLTSIGHVAVMLQHLAGLVATGQTASAGAAPADSPSGDRRPRKRLSGSTKGQAS